MTSNQLVKPPAPPQFTRPFESSQASSLHSLRVENNSSNGEPGNYLVGGDSFDIEDRPLKRRKVETSEIRAEREGIDEGQELARTGEGKGGLGAVLLTDLSLIFRSEFGTEGDSHRDIDNEDGEPPTFPRRPGTSRETLQNLAEPVSTHRIRNIRPVPNVPDIHEASSSITQQGHEKPPDYFPWTGKQPEDLINDVHVKQGYFDQAPNPPEKELNTARFPLYDVLKHQSGLEGLSTLLSALLEQKSRHGLLSSNTTFKPPSRVTFTESKRKSWISDLANPEVSLRKLCRTIPQGIRGQILLDQCLQNHVPMSRAIWFAKCVGALDMRLLKRKGAVPSVAMAAENKWLREWTINVQQFLYSILTEQISDKWKTNMDYALHLSTRLYLEDLVDRDHFLDWITQSFASSNVDFIPFWLVMIEIYWLDLSAFCKRAKILAQSLIDKFDQFRPSHDELISSLAMKLRKMIRKTAYERPACFLEPDRWPKYYTVLRTCLNIESSTDGKILDSIRQSNERCMGENKSEYLSRPSLQEKIITALDSFTASDGFSELDKKLIHESTDINAVIQLCVEWSTTVYRYSSHRIYVVSRLLKRWSRNGRDIDFVLFEILSRYRKSTELDTKALKHLVAELSRSRVLSANKYLQSLLVRGLPRKGTSFVHHSSSVQISQNQIENNSANEAESEASLVLLDFCFFEQHQHVMHLRNSMLENAGFDVNAEVDLTHTLIDELDGHLSRLGLSGDQFSIKPPTFVVPLDSLPWSNRFTISRWLRNRIFTIVRSASTAHNEKALHRDLETLNLPQFEFVRYVLELLEDEAILADVLELLSSSSQEKLLASMVDTIHFHFETFAALGALNSLLEKLSKAYMTLRNHFPTIPVLATALLEFCTSYPNKAVSTRLLQQDIVKGDRGRAIAACSPFSDGIAESLQQAGATFIEDFEAILQSEPNMNEQTLFRLFTLLTERIEKETLDENSETEIFSLCQLLARLRLSRKIQTEHLLTSWLLNILSFNLPDQSKKAVITSLLATGCITFDSITQVIFGDNSNGRVLTSATKLLQPLLSSQRSEVIKTPIEYGLAVKWYSLMRRKPEVALRLMLEAGSTSEDISSNRQLLTCLAFKEFDLSHLPKPALLSMQAGLGMIIMSKLESNDFSVVDLLQNVNLFSYQFVELSLRLMSTQTMAHKSEEPESLPKELADTFIQMLTCSERHMSRLAISKLLLACGIEIATLVRRKTENNFIESISILQSVRQQNGYTFDQSDITTLCSTLETAFSACLPNTSPSSRFVAQLVERVRQCLKLLGSPVQINASTSSNSTGDVTSPTSMTTPSGTNTAVSLSNGNEAPSRPPSDSVFAQLESLLSMICLQRPNFQSPIPPALGAGHVQSQQEQIRLLIGLGMIATHSALLSPQISFPSKKHESRANQISDFAYDVMSTLVEHLNEESRIRCMRSLKDRMTDSRLKWLFGDVSTFGSQQTRDVGHGLSMIKEGKGVLGEWKPKVWEILENGSGLESESCLGLGLFGARRS